MKNKLTDLNDHLFTQLERLCDETLTPDQITAEVQRTGAIVGVAEQIVRAADMQLKAVAVLSQHQRLQPYLTMLKAADQ